MKKCSQCNFENNISDVFCKNCGNRLDDQSIKTDEQKATIMLKGILVIIGGLAIGLLLIGIFIFFILSISFQKGLDVIDEKMDEYVEQNETKENNFDSIPKELISRELFSKDLKFIGNGFEWGMESTDDTIRYYLYIDSNNYDKYKNYWLEDIEKSKYREGYNSELSDYGDYVFKAIRISELSQNNFDTEYVNVHLKANKAYYLVTIYEEAIFYKEITYADHNKKTYHIKNNHDCKEDSISKEYIFYKENDKWEIEEIIR